MSRERVRRGVDRLQGTLPPETTTTGYLLRLSRPRFWFYLAGPVAVVYPEGAWYHSVKKRTARRIVTEHLAGGEVLGDHVFLENDLR